MLETLHAYSIPLLNGFAYGLVLFTVAAGLTLAFGVADVLNLAHGTVYLAGGYLGATLSNGSWAGLALGIGAAVVIGSASGGLLAAAVEPLRQHGHLAQALLTFGMALVGGYALVALFGAQEVRATLPTALAGSIELAGKSYPLYRLTFIAVAAVLALVGWIVLTYTTIGARVRATVDDRDMMACSGTNPRTVLAGVLVTAGGLAGLGGALGGPILGLGGNAGHEVLLLSLVIVVLGRPGSIGGAFVAAMFVGHVQNLGIALFSHAAPYLLFAAMAVVLLLRRHHGLRTTAS